VFARLTILTQESDLSAATQKAAETRVEIKVRDSADFKLASAAYANNNAVAVFKFTGTDCDTAATYELEIVGGTAKRSGEYCKAAATDLKTGLPAGIAFASTADKSLDLTITLSAFSALANQPITVQIHNIVGGARTGGFVEAVLEAPDAKQLKLRPANLRASIDENTGSDTTQRNQENDLNARVRVQRNSNTGDVTYAIVSDAAGIFGINSSNGKIFVTRDYHFDHEAKSAYTLTVSATDSVATVEGIFVLSINDQAETATIPDFESNAATLTVMVRETFGAGIELPGRILLTATLTEGHPGVMWSLEGRAADLQLIGISAHDLPPVGGQSQIQANKAALITLKTKATLDFEASQEFMTVTVVATSSAGAGKQPLVIRLANIADETPGFSFTSASYVGDSNEVAVFTFDGSGCVVVPEGESFASKTYSLEILGIVPSDISVLDGGAGISVSCISTFNVQIFGLPAGIHATKTPYPEHEVVVSITLSQFPAFADQPLTMRIHNGRPATGTYAQGVLGGNSAPVFGADFPDQQVDGDAGFTTAAFPAATDEDDGDTVTYSAALVGGGALPGAVTFDSSARTFTIASGTAATTLMIEVTATDGTASVKQTFELVIRVAGIDAPATATLDKDTQSATLPVKLTNIPANSGAVTLAVTSGDSADVSVESSDLVFNSSNWNTAQNATIMLVDDTVKGARDVAINIAVADATNAAANYVSVQPVVVNVAVDVINDAPVFAAAEQSRDLAEAAYAADETLMFDAIAATDEDNDDAADLNYSLVGTSELFAIEVKGGALKSKVATTFNHEASVNTYKVTVQVDDGEDAAIRGRATVTVAIMVTDINEAPVFVGGNSVSRVLAENMPSSDQTAVDTSVGAVISALDPDEESTTSISGVVTYTLDDDSSLFKIEKIDDDSAQIKVATATHFNHERQDVYKVTVTATDGATDALSAKQEVIITLTDVRETPDDYTSHSFTVDGTTADEITLSWNNNEYETQFAAEDRYSLVISYGSGGTAASGSPVTLAADATAATLTGLDAETTYQITLNWLSADERLSATPATTSGSTAAEAKQIKFRSASLRTSIDENTGSDTTQRNQENDLNARVRVQRNSNTGDVTYAIVSDAAGIFGINSSNGKIFVTRDYHFDHEAKSAYTLTVSATDSVATVEGIFVLSINDQAETATIPDFESNAATLTVMVRETFGAGIELPGRILLTATLTEGHPGVMWSLEGRAADLQLIGISAHDLPPVGGQSQIQANKAALITLKTKATLDFEASQEFMTVTVVATSSAGAGKQPLVIRLANIADETPGFSFTSASYVGDSNEVAVFTFDGSGCVVVPEGESFASKTYSLEILGIVPSDISVLDGGAGISVSCISTFNVQIFGLPAGIHATKTPYPEHEVVVSITLSQFPAFADQPLTMRIHNGRPATGTYAQGVLGGNSAPVFGADFPDQQVDGDAGFTTAAFPAATDEDDGDTVTYSAALVGGGALPGAVTFDSSARTFTIASGTAATTLMIEVTATDGTASVKQTFELVIRVAGIDAPATATLDKDTQSATLPVKLTNIPANSGAVTLAVTSGDSADVSVESSDLVFNSSNWNTAQNATIMLVDDTVKGARDVAINIAVADATNAAANYVSVQPVVVNVAVDVINDAPVFAAAEQSRDLAEAAYAADETLMFDAIAATDEDNDDAADLNYSLVGTSELFAIEVKGGALKSKVATTFNHEASVNTYKVTVQVDDGEDAAIRGRATVTVAIMVTNVPEAPVFAGDQPKRVALIGQTRKLTLVATSDDDAGDSVTYSIKSRPSWITHESGNSQIINIAANDAAAGLHTITIVATDTGSQTAEQALTLDVFPQPSLTKWKVDIGTSEQVNALLEIASEACASKTRQGANPGIAAIQFAQNSRTTSCTATNTDFNITMDDAKVQYEWKTALGLGSNTFSWYYGLRESDPQNDFYRTRYNVTYDLAQAMVTIAEIPGSSAAVNTKLLTLTLANAVADAQWSIIGTPDVPVGLAAVSGSETTEGALSLTSAAAVDFEAGASFLMLTLQVATSTPGTGAIVDLNQVVRLVQIDLSNVNDLPVFPDPFTLPSRFVNGVAGGELVFPAATDQDAGDSITYTYTRENSASTSLPSGVTFEAANRKFVVAANTDPATLTIKVIATDTSSAQAEQTFSFQIVDAGIDVDRPDPLELTRVGQTVVMSVKLVGAAPSGSGGVTLGLTSGDDTKVEIAP
ncbi:MAG: putative Ig domain-containing protein, partial [Betaproteobacteria bacterium]|nr:putative Ig domain-containing protein [Betaproteobacteria bacterium]